MSIKELSDETTPHAYQSRVILSARPNNISVTEKKPDALDAMQEVLEEVVRQVREKREQLRNC